MIRHILAGGASRLLGLVLAAALSIAAGQAMAQSGNSFAPVAYVNDRAITGYELSQRMQILRLFRTPGDLQEVALEQLIDDRLRMDAAREMGISLSPEEITAGMEEFAGRVNMDLETFLGALAEQGVASETLRDFIEAGAAWREVVRGRFGPRAEISDAEVDRALSQSGNRGGAVVQLAEILLPARNAAEQARAEELAAELSRTVTTQEAFAAAAREYSVAPTATRGGNTGRATAVSELPPALRSEVLRLAPGQVTSPISTGSAIGIFQVLSIRDTGLTESQAQTLKYAEYLIPGGRTEATLREAAKITDEIDTCDDLYGINHKQAPERLTFQTRPISEVPQDVALELSKLDDGEVSTMLTRGGNLLFLMMCSRTPAFEDAPDRENVRLNLFGQRLASLGDGYLAELRARALIRYP